MVPRAVLIKSVNAARPMSYLSKTAHSTVKKPIHKNTTFKNSNINQRVNTVEGKDVNTARPKAVVNAVKGNNFNAVKDSSYYEEIDGGYVAFRGNPKGGKITGKGKAKKSVRLMMGKMVIRENRQRVLVRKRIERIGENKNRKRVVWNKNRQSDLVSKRIERSAKTVNGEVQIHALVDGKKIIITESIVRRDLQLEDAEGVDFLPNATIFEQLALMCSKTTAWNEFSSTMASAIICLATEACSFMLCDLDFEPSSLSLSSMPSCDLECLTNILILCLILKASNQSLRKSLSLNLELS
ncbi:hypothetical protein Tco_1408803 [Tanacetum coccineum]